MNYQTINNIAEICAAHYMEDAVLSPGSRNAPLTYSFVRNKQIKTYSISDERSAGFIALGMAVQSKRPVALVCTSGSAAYNYAPAVAEAYFQHIPLVILTADRPPEWIDQLDGQTIRQQNLYGNHVKGFYNCPVDTDSEEGKWHLERIINEALISACDGQQGPVHINVPFREPFYPDSNAEITGQGPKIISKLRNEQSLHEFDWVNLVDEWRSSKKRLIVGGQGSMLSEDLETLSNFSTAKNIPIIGDVISNLHGLTAPITLADSFIGLQSESQKEALQPDLLITFGKSVISKHLKLFLRKYKPKFHWHIQPHGYAPDTYQSLTKVVPVSIISLVNSIDQIAAPASLDYLEKWASLQKETSDRIQKFSVDQPFNEFSAVHTILENLPLACNIHLANSMPVRWANMFGLDHTRLQVEIFCNRGTSGIDGSTSTAVGAAMKSDTTTLLITGDMAFFYDRNAFWNKYIPDNLRVIVLNNHGGGIFDIIDGPSSQPEHEEYFLTNQPLSAKAVAEEFGHKYYHCKSIEGLSKGLDKFWIQDGSAKILEIETDIKMNTATFKKLKKELKRIWN